jgi:flavin-dependent dehydrogenase
MAVGKNGYVGTVQVEDNHLSVAAALDAKVLKSGESPLIALQEIYESNGLTAPANLNSASIKGTLPLTRSTSPVALRRILLLGDAVGYVEPFTGEGMAWAMTSADLVMPLIDEVIRNGWNQTLPSKWASLLKQDVRQRQQICRLLSRSLRFPWLLSPMVNACRLFPAAAESLVRRMNHVPSAKKV